MLLASKVPPAEPLLPPAIDGGGGTTLGAPRVGAEDDAIERVPVPPESPAEGGGATTFDPSVAPMPFRVPRGLPPEVFADVVGGGATTFAARVAPAPLVLSD